MPPFKEREAMREQPGVRCDLGMIIVSKKCMRTQCCTRAWPPAYLLGGSGVFGIASSSCTLSLLAPALAKGPGNLFAHASIHAQRLRGKDHVRAQQERKSERHIGFGRIALHFAANIAAVLKVMSAAEPPTSYQNVRDISRISARRSPSRRVFYTHWRLLQQMDAQRHEGNA